MGAARQIENDAHEMVVDLAKTLGEERAARLAAEAALEEERTRRILTETKLRKTVEDAKAAIRKVQDELLAQVEEARNLLRMASKRTKSPRSVGIIRQGFQASTIRCYQQPADLKNRAHAPKSDYNNHLDYRAMRCLP